MGRRKEGLATAFFPTTMIPLKQKSQLLPLLIGMFAAFLSAEERKPNIILIPFMQPWSSTAMTWWDALSIP